MSDLPSSTLCYLKQLLSDNPQFGRAVVNDLTHKGKGFLKNNQLLQQLYIDLIEEQLGVLDSSFAMETNAAYSTPLSKEESTGDSEAYPCKFIYQMLSYMNPSPEMNSLSQHLDELFQDLVNRTNRSDHGCLDKGTVYSCLLSPPTTYLIDKFCSIENQMRFLAEGHPELPLPRHAVQEFKQQGHSVGSFVQVCYAQSFMEDRKSAWQYLFFHALEGNHVLENIVVRFSTSRESTQGQIAGWDEDYLPLGLRRCSCCIILISSPPFYFDPLHIIKSESSTD